MDETTFSRLFDNREGPYHLYDSHNRPLIRAETGKWVLAALLDDQDQLIFLDDPGCRESSVLKKTFWAREWLSDLITMGMILHDWNLERKMHLIRAAYDALPPGAALVAIEALIDDARRENVFGLLMSLSMLIEFGDAFDYSGADFRRWCGEVGFTRFDVLHLAGASSAAIAYK